MKIHILIVVLTCVVINSMPVPMVSVKNQYGLQQPQHPSPSILPMISIKNNFFGDSSQHNSGNPAAAPSLTINVFQNCSNNTFEFASKSVQVCNYLLRILRP